MKKQWKLTFILSLLTVFFLSAQEKPPISYGFKAGLNVNKMITRYKEGGGNSSDSPIGWHSGLFVDIPISPILHVQPELFFNRLGQQLKEGYDPTTGELGFTDIKDDNNLISLPIMLKAYPIPASKTLYVAIGPDIQYNLSAKMSAKDLDGNDVSFPITNNNTLLFGANFGLGYHTPISGLSATFRYHRGLTPIGKEVSIFKLYHSSIQIGIVYDLTATR